MDISANKNHNNVNSEHTENMISKLEQYRTMKSAMSSTVASMSSIVHSNASHMEEIPSLLMDGQSTRDDYSFHMPADLATSPSKYKIVPTHEVIVANIHLNYSIYYILHLFKKHNPISISLMKIIPNTGIQYCHVYFKTWEEALETEKEFDQFKLGTQKLIVLTESNLHAESLLP